MASFTDEISKFNPYVQQLPVEAMAQVGMYKQQQYDQGVQKIQSTIDNVAGMDVYKQEHKAYLQSKLNELGGKLRSVAAGDFSNQQLVNSVGGMAGSIIKDPIVQNAVYSTQKIRKGDADREAASKAGKSSPNNDRNWEKQKARWLNDKNISSPFNGGYVEFYDVDKTLLDRADKILSRPDEYVVDIPWQSDEAGRTKYFYNEVVKDATGKTVIDPKTKKPVVRETYSFDPSKGTPREDDAMKKISIKGTSASKLFNNFLDSIDGRAAQQLRIDAEAKYEGITAEAFTKDIVGVYENKKKFQSQEIVNLSVALKNPDLTDVEKTQITAKLNKLNVEERDGVIDKQLNATLQALQNPAILENYKTEIYTQQHLMSMATDMATRSYKQEIDDNPYTQMNLKKKDFLFRQQQFADERARGWKALEYTGRRLEFDINKERQKWLEDHPNQVVLPGTLPTDTAAPTFESEQLVLKAKGDAITAVSNKWASVLFPGMKDDQIRKGFNKLIDDYTANPKANYSPDQLNFLKENHIAQRDFVNYANLLTSADAEGKKYVESEIKSKVKGVGRYSSEDIADATMNLEKFNVRGIGKGPSFLKDEAFAYFKQYKGGKYLPLLEARFNKETFRNNTSEQKALLNAMYNAKEVIDGIYSEGTKVTNNYLAEHNPMALIQRSALDMGKPNDKAAINKFLTGKISEEASINGSGGLFGSGPASKISGWLNGKDGNNARFELQKSKNGNVQLLAISPDGKDTEVLTMKTAEQDFFPSVKETSIIEPYTNSIRNSKNHTTNLIGQRDSEVNPVNAVNAAITGYDLPQLANDPIAPLVRFDIEGAPFNKGDDYDEYSLIMYVHPPGSAGWKGKRMHTGYAKAGGIVNIMNGIGNVGVKQAMKTWK